MSKSSLKNFDKLPILTETLIMRSNFFQKLSKNKINFNPNLSKDQLNSLNIFKKEKNFTVLQCDKNIGSLIISNELPT